METLHFVIPSVRELFSVNRGGRSEGARTQQLPPAYISVLK